MVNPFASMRMDSIFGGDQKNRKRFLSNILPFQQAETQTPPLESRNPLDIRSMSWTPSENKPEIIEPEEENEGSKYFSELERIRGNRGPALSAYQKHLDTLPTREATKPSKLRRFGGALVGAAAGLQGG